MFMLFFYFSIEMKIYLSGEWMKKYIVLSVVTVGLLSPANAAEDLGSMFTQGKVSGQIREYSISRSVDYSKPTKEDYTRKANAIGGYLKYVTDDYKGLDLGVAFYTTNGFGLKSDKANNKRVDPTLLGKDNESYSLLGEAFVDFKYENTTFKGGRQKLNTPMAGADDARMIPNLFEAYIVTNTDLADTTLLVGHITRFAQGTFGRAYGTGGILGATAGYSAVDAANQVGEFRNMGTYALDKSTAGVSVASITYAGIEGLKVQLWDYYAYDILNIAYGQVDFKWNCLITDSVKPFVAAQFVKEDDVGDNLLKTLGGNGNIDSFYWGAKAGVKIENFTGYVAYSQTGKNSNTDTVYANAIISPWGGMPAFTQGMVTRHVFLAGTKAKKIALSYNWKNFGADLKTVIYYASYNMDKNNGYTFGDTDEKGFDIIYNTGFVKGLQLRVRANYSDDFNVARDTSTVGWDEYRFIANYSF